MHVPSNKAPASRFALTVVAIGSIVLLVLAIPAHAEPVPEGATPEVPASDSIPVEQTPDPGIAASLDTPEPEQPEAVTVEKASDAVESGAATLNRPSVASPDLDPVAASEPSGTTSPPSQDEGNAPAKANLDTSLVAEAADRASRAAGTVRRDPALEDQATPVERVSRSAPSPDFRSPAEATGALWNLPGVERLVQLTEDVVGNAAGSVRVLPGLSSLAPTDVLPPHEGMAPALAGGASPEGKTVAPMGARYLSGSPLTNVETGVTNVLGRYLSGFTGNELAPFGPPGRPENLVGHPPPAFVPLSTFSAETSGGRPGDRAPIDAPAPPQTPGAPAAAAGSSGSSFVPIVALLALLALVAPAIRRRLRVAPVFRAPTPFVCALERPG